MLIKNKLLIFTDHVFNACSISSVYVCLLALLLYQWFISPLLGTNCRYYPTCSSYAIKSLQNYGIVIGLRLSLYRVLRCNPWGGWGYDPLPKYSLNKENEQIRNLL